MKTQDRLAWKSQSLPNQEPEPKANTKKQNKFLIEIIEFGLKQINMIRNGLISKQVKAILYAPR